MDDAFFKVDVLGRNLRERLRVGRHKRGRSGAKRKEEMRRKDGGGGGGYERVLGLRGGKGRRGDALSSLFGERCPICRMEKGVRGHQAMCRPRVAPTACPGCRWLSVKHNTNINILPEIPTR